MWLKIILILVLILVCVTAVAITFGAWRWGVLTRELRTGLATARLPMDSQRVDFSEFESLPPPVRRYFQVALKDGQSMVAGIHVEHVGMFNMGEATDQWKPFRSEQAVVTHRPGFVWDGRVRIFPGISARVHDAYVAGEGILHASVLGLVSVVDIRGSGELAEGELMRFFAEAAWYPTALLPAAGVRWEPVDERSSRATMIDGPHSVTLLFTFDEQGLISVVRAEARGRAADGGLIPTPWEGRFRNYGERNGMLIPLDGEVAWLLPEGDRPYWRGQIHTIVYEFAL